MNVTLPATAQSTHCIKDSRGRLYVNQLVKHTTRCNLDGYITTIPHFTTRRCDASGNPIPRIRCSKKLRIKLRRHLCSAASMNSTSVSAAST